MVAGSAAQRSAEQSRANRFALLEQGMALLLLLVLVLMYTEIPPVLHLMWHVRIAAPHPRNLLTSGSDPLFLPPKYVVQSKVSYNLPRWILLYRYPYVIPFPCAMLRTGRIL